MAVQNGDVEVVRLLDHHGADMNSPNYRAMSPLAVACKRQDCVMVNVLLDLKVCLPMKCRRPFALRYLTGDFHGVSPPNFVRVDGLWFSISIALRTAPKACRWV